MSINNFYPIFRNRAIGRLEDFPKDMIYSIERHGSALARGVKGQLILRKMPKWLKNSYVGSTSVCSNGGYFRKAAAVGHSGLFGDVKVQEVQTSNHQSFF